MRTRAYCSGYTLLEILIAVVVLALGVMGGVALQMAALRTRHQAALLSQATQLATAMAERMRVNAGQMRLADGDNLYLTLNYDALNEPRPPAPAALCYGAACGDAQLALSDLYETKLLVRQNLPAGRVVICRDGGLWSGGKLRWACGGGAAAPLVIKVGWRGKHPDGTPLTDDSGEYMPGVALAVGAVR
jgi:type IV pilus assembly protein PilV